MIVSLPSRTVSQSQNAKCNVINYLFTPYYTYTLLCIHYNCLYDNNYNYDAAVHDKWSVGRDFVGPIGRYNISIDRSSGDDIFIEVCNNQRV